MCFDFCQKPFCFYDFRRVANHRREKNAPRRLGSCFDLFNLFENVFARAVLNFSFRSCSVSI